MGLFDPFKEWGMDKGHGKKRRFLMGREKRQRPPRMDGAAVTPRQDRRGTAEVFSLHVASLSRRSRAPIGHSVSVAPRETPGAKPYQRGRQRKVSAPKGQERGHAGNAPTDLEMNLNCKPDPQGFPSLARLKTRATSAADFARTTASGPTLTLVASRE